MKSTITTAAIAIAFMITISFTNKTKTANRAIAVAEQEQGVFVFMQCKPACSYKVLGAVDMPDVVGSGRPRELMSKAVWRAVKQYPQANGVIFQHDNKADAVRIEE